MRLRDVLGQIYQDTTFAGLFSHRGRPAEAPWRLALISVMQFAERLSDRRAADAVRGRTDRKYALGVPLDERGFDAKVLCEFRARGPAASAEQQLLDALLTLCRDRGWLHARGRQRIDSTHVLAAIRAHNRVKAMRETVRHALNVLAEQAPDRLHHLTETCEPETPNLITDVQTVLAPIADWDSLPLIHQGLAKRALLPDQHLVDSGYADADLPVASRRDFGIDLVGPPRDDQDWQARDQTGFSAEHFRIDWEHQRAMCPEGRTSVSWSPVVDNRRTM